MQRELREGFTTGTAAAAAAAAAVTCLFGAKLPALVSVLLPPFIETLSGPTGALSLPDSASLRIPISGGGLCAGGSAWAEVVKDGGDDPDATHGARITAKAAISPFPADAGSRATPVPVQGFGETITLYGGKGVGIVTLPGLPVCPGEPAINPEPRRQIARAARAAAQDAGYEGPLHIQLEVPDGLERSRRTINARLGILEGISILGTQGTVRAFSHDAWKTSIDQGLSVASALGISRILFSTGRRSERLGFGFYPELAPQAGVQVGDFAAHAMRSAAKYTFSMLLWACFPGKLLKLAQGLEWTHARSATADISLLVRYCDEAGSRADLIRDVAAMPTAAGAFSLLAKEPRIHATVLRRLTEQAYTALRNWLDAALDGGPSPALRILVFSLDRGSLLVFPEENAPASEKLFDDSPLR